MFSSIRIVLKKLESRGGISCLTVRKLRKIKNRIKMEFKPWGFTCGYIIFPIIVRLRIRGLIKSDARYKNILKYKDRYKGKKCYVVATGPSLKVEDVELIKSEYSFAVNTIFKLFDKTEWRPHFYVMVDSILHRRLEREYKLDFDDFAKEVAILNAENKKIIHCSNCILLNYNYMDHVYHYGVSKKFKYSNNFLYAFYDNYSVTQDSMVLAMYMGFSTICLLGADNNYLGKNQHFDDHEGKRDLDEDNAVLTQQANDLGYSFIGRLAKRKGVKIYNCTRGGNVKEFDRISLEESISL